MKIIKSKVAFIVTLFVLIFLSSFVLYQQAKPWPVPESAKVLKNPIKGDSESVTIGKNLFAKHCRSCHGKTGEGDGSKAAELETFPGDFTVAAFQNQTDGEIFYKTSEGRDDMPSFKKKISQTEDIWALVNYLRTLKAN